MVSAVSSVSQTYAVYFRTTRQTSIANVRCLKAEDIATAKIKARESVAKHYPEGVVLSVMLAKDSPWPLMDANGNFVAPCRA